MTTEPIGNAPLPAKAWRTESVAMSLLFALLCGYYLWAIMPERGLFSEQGSPRDYYNLLIDGFRSGHTYLATPVDPRMTKLADPYDPLQNAPYRMHDAAYFQGHFYLYFGVTPAVTLFWPCAALTGRYLSDTQAVWINACLGLGFALALLARLRWRFFPSSPSWHLLTAGLALGLCTMVPALLARASVWEVPISSAYAFLCASLFFLFGGAYGRRPLLSLSLASVCYGLAVGARPTYAFGAVALLVPAWIAWKAGGPGRNRAVLRRLAVAVLPIAAVVIGLLAYNQARFGSPFDFGFHYQMTGADERGKVSFSPRYLGYDSWLYLFSAAHWSPYFPFVRIIAAPPAPEGYLGIEDPYGIFPNLPVTLFVLGLLWAWRGLKEFRPFAAGLLAALAAISLTVFMFGGATNRYMVDFVPMWTLCAAIGLLALARLISRRRILGAAWFVALAISVVFGIFSGLGHNELLREEYPKTYESLAHTLDWPSRVTALLTGKHYRPLSIRLRLPKERVGKLEPLLVSGVGFMSDYVYLLYSSKDTLIVGFEHTGHGGPATQLIPVDYDKPHVITLEAGFLFPPLESPYFDRMGRAEAVRRRSQYRVLVDGVPYLSTSTPVYDPVGFAPLVGTTSQDRTAFGPAFTGEILSVSDAPLSPAIVPQVSGTPLRLAILVPPFTRVHAEPLVTTGITGAGDSLFIKYLDPVHIAFGFDHWSAGGPTSAPIAINPGYAQKLTISLGSFYGAGGRPPEVSEADWKKLQARLFVSLNDKPVFDEPQPFYPSYPSQIAVGSNPIGTSSSEPQFTGRILAKVPAAFSDLGPSAPAH